MNIGDHKTRCKSNNLTIFYTWPTIFIDQKFQWKYLWYQQNYFNKMFTKFNIYYHELNSKFQWFSKYSNVLYHYKNFYFTKGCIIYQLISKLFFYIFGFDINKKTLKYEKNYIFIIGYINDHAH